MTDDIKEFNEFVKNNVEKLGSSQKMQELGVEFLKKTGEFNYSYNFSWMGVPIIQYPQDMVAMQEIIWKIKPDLIIETGVARGGSIVFYSSLMDMMNIDNGKVVGIDIDIRSHNRAAIENHPTAKRIHLVEGSAIDVKTVKQVERIALGSKKTVVCLDSMHTHDHVLEELRLYSKFVTQDSYLVVFDTSIEDMPEDYFPNRPWGVGNSPMSAVKQFLQEGNDFEIDKTISDKMLVTVARNGFLKRK